VGVCVRVCLCVCEREGRVRETIEYVDDMTPVKLNVFTTMMWQELIYSQNHQNLENSSGKKYSGVFLVYFNGKIKIISVLLNILYLLYNK
jgi:hypothetical protein